MARDTLDALMFCVPSVVVRLKMKLIKCTLFVATFLLSAEAAHAVGPMAKADIREGQLICQSGQRLKSAAERRSERNDKQEQNNAPANAGSAL